MEISYRLHYELGEGTYLKFQSPGVRHPLIRALLGLGVSKQTIVRAMGVHRISSLRWTPDPFLTLSDEEYELLDLLIVATRCAAIELKHLKASADSQNSHPLQRISSEHDIQNLEANISYANKMVQYILDNTQGDYRVSPD